MIPGMSPLVPVTLLAWVPATLLIFASQPPTRAMLLALIAGWLLLPPASYPLPGLPDFSKVSSIGLSIVLATLVFTPDRLLAFRPRLLDVPMLVWCLCPFESSLSNGLGAYDGLSSAVAQTLNWGVPYLIGRIHLRTLSDFRDLALGLFIGGLVYVPLCLWEVRMSPQLNQTVYGFGGTGIEYSDVMGNWGSRPRVFMGTALTVGMFLTAAAVAGLWLWRTGSARRLGRYPTGPLLSAVLLTAILCKNMGALVGLGLGMATFYAALRLRSRALLYLLVLASPLYMTVRMTGRWSGESFVKLVATVSARRAESFDTRLENEDRLAERALQRPLFGWGGWGRSRVHDEEEDKDITLTDGLWIIALGTCGLVGLSAVTGALLLPALAVARRMPIRLWVHPKTSPCLAVAVIVTLYMLDNLPNSMLNPIYIAGAGGLVTLAAGQLAALARARGAAPLERYSRSQHRATHGVLPRSAGIHGSRPDRGRAGFSTGRF